MHRGPLPCDANSARRRRAAWRCGVALAIATPRVAEAAERDPPRHEESAWVAYMSDWVFHPKGSVWLDAHYNVRAFGVLRGGLTYRTRPGPSFTGGYGHVWTDRGTGTLERREHRPWAQVVFPLRIDADWGFTQRIRYELRIREHLRGGLPDGNWDVLHRVRFQTAITYKLPPLPAGAPFLQLADEVLVHLGPRAGPNYLDQNRLSLALGWTERNFTVRLGYMHRFSPGVSGLVHVHEHGLILWFNHTIELRRRRTASPPEAANP